MHEEPLSGARLPVLKVAWSLIQSIRRRAKNLDAELCADLGDLFGIDLFGLGVLVRNVSPAASERPHGLAPALGRPKANPRKGAKSPTDREGTSCYEDLDYWEPSPRLNRPKPSPHSITSTSTNQRLVEEPMNDTITNTDLAALISAAGHAHHAAYIESDGIDPDWAMYYAGYLEAHLGDRLGRQASRSELTYLLIKAQRQHDALPDAPPFADHYADVLLAG